MKKITSILLSLALVASVFCFGSIETRAEAESKASPYISLDSTYLYNTNVYPGSYVGGLGSSYKITKVTSSNKKVAKITSDSNTKAFYFKTVGAGKSTITVNVSYRNKTYTLKKTIEVVKAKPFKNIKYGNKNLYKGHEFETYHNRNLTSGKNLTWSMNSGYKVLSAHLIRSNGASKRFKNGGKLTLNKGQDAEVYFFIETPDKKYIYYYVGFEN